MPPTARVFVADRVLPGRRVNAYGSLKSLIDGRVSLVLFRVSFLRAMGAACARTARPTAVSGGVNFPLSGEWGRNGAFSSRSGSGSALSEQHLDYPDPSDRP